MKNLGDLRYLLQSKLWVTVGGFLRLLYLSFVMGLSNYGEIVLSLANYGIVITVIFIGSNDLFYNRIASTKDKFNISRHFWDRLWLSCVFLIVVFFDVKYWFVGLFLLLQHWVNWLSIYFRGLFNSDTENRFLLTGNAVKSAITLFLWYLGYDNVKVYFLVLIVVELVVFFVFIPRISLEKQSLKEMVFFQREKANFAYVSFITNITSNANIAVIGALRASGEVLAYWSYVEYIFKINNMISSSVGSIRLRSRLSGNNDVVNKNCWGLLLISGSIAAIVFVIEFFKLDYWYYIAVLFVVSSFVLNAEIYPEAYSSEKFKHLYIIYGGSLSISAVFYFLTQVSATFYLFYQGFYLFLAVIFWHGLRLFTIKENTN